MQKVLQPGGTAYGRGLSGRPSAGKTGTTDKNTNAWFTGFTPQLCTSVWIGNVDRNKTVSAGGVGEVFGGTLPAEVWQQMMNAALATKPVVPFPRPVGVGKPEASSTATPTTSTTPTVTVSPTTSTVPTTSVSPTLSPTSSATESPPPTPTESQSSQPFGPGAPPQRGRR
jgi:membrane peptidoglycan carboxypeptidase